MNECEFKGSMLETAINNITSDNDFGIRVERLSRFYRLSKETLQGKPQSKFWAEAVKLLDKKLGGALNERNTLLEC